MRRINKKHFTLLEVMIAFMLISLCVLPLIYPHAFLLKAQRAFINRTEVDHLVNLHYAELMEKMYRNEIPLEAILSETPVPISEDEIQKLTGGKTTPYRGMYRFEKNKHKPDDTADYIVYLRDLRYVFTKGDETLHYDYQVVVVKDSAMKEEKNEDTQESSDAA